MDLHLGGTKCFVQCNWNKHALIVDFFFRGLSVVDPLDVADIVPNAQCTEENPGTCGILTKAQMLC